MNTSAMIDRVIDQGGFDNGRADVLAWLDEKHKIMVAASRWNEQIVTVGNTVDGTGEYTVPSTVIEISDALMVYYDDGPLRHQKISQEQAWGLETGTLRRDSASMWFAEQYDSSGNLTLLLVPEPEESGAAIKCYANVVPSDLVDSVTSQPITPIDTHPAICEGAIGTGLALMDERLDAADRYEARFTAVANILAGRKMSRVNGGPVTLQVQGKHF